MDERTRPDMNLRRGPEILSGGPPAMSSTAFPGGVCKLLQKRSLRFRQTLGRVIFSPDVGASTPYLSARDIYLTPFFINCCDIICIIMQIGKIEKKEIKKAE